jgi:CxxC-x17-CxxC domain-containing protein
MATLEDKTIKCADCGEEFLFTVGEQEFYREHGLTNFPTRCRGCREARKARRPDHGRAASHGGHGAGRERETHRAVCANCGAETEVPFAPTAGRPVYCRTCFQASKRSAPAPARHANAARPARVSSGGRQEGVVKWFNAAKGFGFIQTADGEDIYLHSSAIQGEGHRGLTEGDHVAFDIGDSGKGKQATNVTKV